MAEPSSLARCLKSKMCVLLIVSSFPPSQINKKPWVSNLRRYRPTSKIHKTAKHLSTPTTASLGSQREWGGAMTGFPWRASSFEKKDSSHSLVYIGCLYIGCLYRLSTVLFYKIANEKTGIHLCRRVFRIWCLVRSWIASSQHPDIPAWCARILSFSCVL